MRRINREPLTSLDKRIVSFPSGQSHTQYLFECEDCKAKHWVSRSLWLLGQSRRCKSCGHRYAGLSTKGRPKVGIQGKKSHLYRKGFTITNGYRIVSVPLGHPFRCMADRYGRLLEHRLKMAMKLGRALEGWEIVHHKDRNKSNNRLSNLVLLSGTMHVLVTRMEREIMKLRKRIKELE